MSDYIVTSDGELYHWGIKGQKWGVRRFQNKDGTRTPAGLKRYGDKAKEGLKKAGDKLKERHTKRKSEKAAEKLRKKPISELTDDELQARIVRAQKEKQLFDLERPMSSLTKTQENLGKKFLVNAGQKVIGPALVDAGKDIMTRFLKDRVGNALGLNGKDVDDAMKALRDAANKSKLERDKSDNERRIQENKEWFDKRANGDSNQQKSNKQKNQNDSSENASSSGAREKINSDRGLFERSSSSTNKIDASNDERTNYSILEKNVARKKSATSQLLDSGYRMTSLEQLESMTPATTRREAISFVRKYGDEERKDKT